MGYYTNHNLKFEANDDVTDKIIDYICEQGLNYEMQSINEDDCSYNGSSREGDEPIYFACEDTKWYNHELDMRRMSTIFPTVLFELHGNGEENGDMWIEYYRDGLMQREVAKLTFGEFDDSKLT